jgi:hypothetical protein
MNKHELILDFCKQFRSLGAENCFSNGMCYWFAHILKERFIHESTEIMYAEIPNHFACRINDRIYDITGDITDKYNWESWERFSFKDFALTERIIRDCVDKFPSHTPFCGTCLHAFTDEWSNLICNKDNHPVQYNQSCNLKGE